MPFMFSNHLFDFYTVDVYVGFREWRQYITFCYRTEAKIMVSSHP